MELPQHIYHLAEKSNWPSIKRNGLLSTSALMELAQMRATARARHERQHRADNIELQRGMTVREQTRIPPEALRHCLVGISPAQWYVLLNRRVFLWLNIDRLNRQRNACAKRPQVVMIIDTRQLLTRYAAAVSLSPINTGNARRNPAVRGRATFVPYARWLRSGWASEADALGTRLRPQRHMPVEFTVKGGIPDVFSYVVAIAELRPGQSFKAAKS